MIDLEGTLSVGEVIGGEGTTNYNSLENKPQINGEELRGNKSSQDFGIQDTLISGTNIKTINNQSILGSGNIIIESGSEGTLDYNDLENKPKINGSDLSGNKTSTDLGLQEKLSSGTNIKTINGTSILGSGNLVIESGEGGLSSVAHDDTMTGAGTNASPLKVDTTKIAQKSDIPDTSNFITKSVNDLTNYTKTSDLGSLATKSTVNYETEVTNKPTIPSQVTEATVSGWGFTKNTGTYSKPSGGIPKSDLTSTVQASLNKADSALQEHQSLSNYYTKSEVDGKVSSVYKYKGTVATYSALPSTGLTIGDVYNVESDGSNYAWTGTTWDKLGGDIDLSNYQTKISSSNKLSSDLVDDTSKTNKFVTTTEKTTWNSKYDKPSGGIPKSDLDSSVQASLSKADTALQTEQYTGTYSKPSGGIPKSDLASSVQTSLGKADTALQSYTEQYTGTITGITMNGTSKGTSGVVDLGTVITSHQDISGKQDKLVAGTNITIANDGKTISATDTTYSNATTSASGLMSAADKTKLNGIATGAEVNVQANWNETNSSSDAYIQNKPTIPTASSLFNSATLSIVYDDDTTSTLNIAVFK